MLGERNRSSRVGIIMARRTVCAASLAVIAAMLAGCGDRTGVETRRAQESLVVDPSTAFFEMTDRHAAQYLRVSPELATSLGVSEDVAGEGYHARLGDYGFEASQRARELNERFLQELKSVDRASLGGTAAITYDVLKYAYETGARRNQFSFGGASVWGGASPYVVTQLTGPQLFLPRLLQTQHPVDNRATADAYLARLEEFGRVFDELIEVMGGDAAQGVTPPDFALQGAANGARAFIASPPAQNPLVTTFAAKLEEVKGLSKPDRDRYEARAAELVETVAYPAYARLAAALDALAPQAGSDAGVWRLGDEGAGFYQAALASYGAGAMTGDEVHALGLAEVARITGEMEAILKGQGLTEGPLTARLERLAAQAGGNYPNTDKGREALLAELRAQVGAVMKIAPDWFATLPEQAVEVRRIPAHEQDSSPGGYYTGPSLDGARPGIYWINLKDTADWPKNTLKTLTYHEAVPGHHFQISLQRAISDMPLIRNLMGFSEFSEGWGLYAEKVAAEMGMYKDDPLGDLGRLQSERFRAARLVVDTGLHHKQWTREQAIDYMVENTNRSRASIVREVERYAVMPGQACSYKLGMLKIEALRARAEAALGERFDLKSFHDEVLLTGSVPLPVLERKIDRWIAAKAG